MRGTGRRNADWTSAGRDDFSWSILITEVPTAGNNMRVRGIIIIEGMSYCRLPLFSLTSSGAQDEEIVNGTKGIELLIHIRH